MNRKILAASTALVVFVAACSGSATTTSPVAPAASTAPVAIATPAPVVTPSPVPVATPEPTPEPIIEEEPEEEVIAPVAFKKAGTVGDWTITITKVNWNAWAAVHRANQFNDKNPKGTTEVMLTGSVKFNGEGREEFNAWHLTAVGNSGVEYSPLDDPSCGVLPGVDMQMDAKTLRKGGSQTGNLACFVVENADLKSLQVFYDDWGGFEDEPQLFNLR
jgi:hypothetical protein